MDTVKYVFDTSSFITWWHEIYSPATFPLTDWVKRYSGLFIDTRALQDAIADTSNECPKILKKQSRINADPAVIALAEEKDAIVVTQENPGKANNIVDCCRVRNVPCISLSKYIEERRDVLDGIRKQLWGRS